MAETTTTKVKSVFEWIFPLRPLREKQFDTTSIFSFQIVPYAFGNREGKMLGYKNSSTNLLAPFPPQYQN